jgi:hypothetical protein
MHAQDMLKQHPNKDNWNLELMERCIQECIDCAQSCTSCADSCLLEQNVKELARCIHANLDCADICETTGKVLSRLASPSEEIVKYQLVSCRTACEICEEECRKHAQHHEHCRICADACKSCRDACEEIISFMG